MLGLRIAIGALLGALVLSLTVSPARSALEDPREAQLMQFLGKFKPSNAPYGGFGGGGCRPSGTRVPVIFIHGNGDFAGNWNAKASGGKPSVIEYFKKAGYNDCELFGVTFLSPEERATPSLNFHRPDKAKIIADFIKSVIRYTKIPYVDVVTHSLGVTMSMQAMDSARLWPHVRRFIAIAGGMRGLNSCTYAGPANPMSTTCAGQNMLEAGRFGFFPHGTAGVHNPRMGDGEDSFVQMPKKNPRTLFYSIRAGINDQIVCNSSIKRGSCEFSSTYEPAPNVISQVNVGTGDHAPIEIDVEAAKHLLSAGGDRNGVGHMRAKTDTARIQLNMLLSKCVGVKCCQNYRNACRE